MASNTTVVPIPQLPQGALDRLFASQRREWLATLDWDLADTVRLVISSLDERSLRGVALLDDGEPVGFSYYSPESDRCLIGDFYVRPRSRTLATNVALAEGVIRHIRRARPRARIEFQALTLDSRGLDDVFVGRGFERYERVFMETRANGAAPLESPGVLVREWRDRDLGPAGDVVFRSYRGAVDARVNAQYSTREGCELLLEALVATVWCGRFLPEVTRVAVDRRTSRCCGVAVAARVSSTAVHLGQISVAPSHQGKGVGAAIVTSAVAAAAESGFTRVTLAVTRANERAHRLYERCGFVPRFDFAVYTESPPPLSVAPRSAQARRAESRDR